MSPANRPLNLNIQNVSATEGSRLFAGAQIQGDLVTGEASLQQSLVNWLDPIDPYVTQNRLRNQRTPGTGEGFLSGRFKEWLDSERRLLWLNGPRMCHYFAVTLYTYCLLVGDGKTFLWYASHSLPRREKLIDHLQ